MYEYELCIEAMAPCGGSKYARREILEVETDSPVEYVKDEVAYMGIIDDECVFVPSEGRDTWSNGTDTYDAENFRMFLKKI